MIVPTVIQSRWRGSQTRSAYQAFNKVFDETRTAIVLFQTYWRKAVARQNFTRLRNASVLIQAITRSFQCRSMLSSMIDADEDTRKPRGEDQSKQQSCTSNRRRHHAFSMCGNFPKALAKAAVHGYLRRRKAGPKMSNASINSITDSSIDTE